MKTFKFIISLFLLSSAFAMAFAAEIKLDPATGSFGDDCLIPVDVVIDTDGKTISATDIIVESSLEFVDFVPGDMFPYFLPPKVLSNTVHIVGFAVEPSQMASGKGTVGTMYFKKSENGERDGSIRLYLSNIGDTIDSNLSLPGGVDILDKVAGAYYTFDVEKSCEHTSGELEGGINADSYEESLDLMLAKIGTDIQAIEDEEVNDILSFVKSNVYMLSLGVLIILVILFYLRKKLAGKK